MTAAGGPPHPKKSRIGFAPLRCTGWNDEVEALNGDQGLSLIPP